MRVSDLVPWRGQTPARREGSGSELQREMNRLFDEFFRGFENAPLGEEGSESFMPSVNVSESDDAIEATFELPGMSEEDIDVSLGRNGLTVRGEKKEEAEETEKNYFRRERSYGYFERTIPVPANLIARDEVEATFDKGVLKVKLPKKEEQQPTSRRIEVKSS